MALQLWTTVLILTIGCMDLCSAKGNCRYQYTEQPIPEISCNPYTRNSRLAMLCTVQTLASNEEHIKVLTWTFVSETGNNNSLRNGSKYTITPIPTNMNSSIKSQLIVNYFQESDGGSYYCQAEFSNGTALPRSQEITVLDRVKYTDHPICNKSRVESVKTSRCVLFTSEIVQPLPPTKPAATSFVTTTMGNGNGTQSEPSIVTMVSDQSIEQTEGDDEGRSKMLSLDNVLLYSAIGTVVFLVLVIILLVGCTCFCNRACDCCQLCS